MRLWLAVAALVLAGCAQPPIAEESAPLQIRLDEETCAGVFFARTPDYQETARWLPPGFRPADVSTVLEKTGYDLPGTGRAFMGAFGAQCETYHFLNFWIAVQPPSLADQDGLHWYEVASYFSDEPITLGLHDAKISPMTATYQGTPEFSLFQGTDDHEILTLDATGTAKILSLDEPLNFWQITETGTLVNQAYVTVTAYSGSASCTSHYEWILDFAAQCDNDDFIAGTLPTMEFGGTYRFFEDQFPV